MKEVHREETMTYIMSRRDIRGSSSEIAASVIGDPMDAYKCYVDWAAKFGPRNVSITIYRNIRTEEIISPEELRALAAPKS